MRFSKRAKEAEQSPSLSLAETMRKLRSNGMEITNFGARPDVPSHVIEAAKSFLDSGKSCEYTDPRGLLELRHAISKKLKRENDIEVNPDTEVVVTLGGKQAIFAALMALIEPGHEVLVEDPGWFCFKTTFSNKKLYRYYSGRCLKSFLIQNLSNAYLRNLSITHLKNPYKYFSI